MRAVRGYGNKSTEVRLRLGMVRGAISGWILRPNDLPGTPDFYFSRSRLAIFVDGCFWHGCSLCGHIPRSNVGFWRTKINLNRKRDQKKTLALTAHGIAVLRFWEHEINDDLQTCIIKVRRKISTRVSPFLS